MDLDRLTNGLKTITNIMDNPEKQALHNDLVMYFKSRDEDSMELSSTVRYSAQQQQYVS